jgi:hypothetical protein
VNVVRAFSAAPRASPRRARRGGASWLEDVALWNMPRAARGTTRRSSTSSVRGHPAARGQRSLVDGAHGPVTVTACRNRHQPAGTARNERRRLPRVSCLAGGPRLRRDSPSHRRGRHARSPRGRTNRRHAGIGEAAASRGFSREPGGNPSGARERALFPLRRGERGGSPAGCGDGRALSSRGLARSI